MQPIYFDYNATTPLDPRVREAMLPFLDETWGNPSSVHQIGRRARSKLDEAHERCSLVLGCKPSEIVFTSGGTEANNLAVLGTARKMQDKGKHLVTSTMEHQAVLNCFDYLENYENFEVTRLPVSRDGVLLVDALNPVLRKDTTLVSVMAANNEIGVVQNVASVGALCRERGVLFHTDAVQWFGKQPFEAISQFNADLVSVCAHKLHGPKGSGALYVRSGLRPHPVLLGGSHENEHRAGTENLAAIAGLTEVLERFVKIPVFPAQLRNLTSVLEEALKPMPGVLLVGSRTQCLSNTISFVVEKADSIALLAGLDLEGVCASSGSACSAGSLEPSHVVKALGYSDQLANALVRFSLGRESTLEQVQQVIRVLPGVLERVQHSQ